MSRQTRTLQKYTKLNNNDEIMDIVVLTVTAQKKV